ncbi:MAG: Ig-like domain-containing protein [Nannocystales bacterium]
MRHNVRDRLRLRRSLSWVTAALLSVGCTGSDPAAEASPDAEKGAETAAPKALDLWAGVPPLVPDAADIATELKPRPGPLKPKSVSETVEIPFPPEVAPDAGVAVTPPPGPLEVQRFGPTGPQTLIDAVRVSFNEAMVPLATVEALEAQDVPLLVDPPIDADAQWLGTRTVALQAKGRLPYSTKYTVTVPETATSIHGHSLSAAKSWTFSTPTLALTSAYPSGSNIDLDTALTLNFNQAIERTALAGALTMRGAGRSVALEVVPSVLSEDASASDKERAARVLTLKPKAKLAKNTSYTIKIPAGVFGEGPERSGAITHSFSTYPPLKLALQACGAPCWASNGIHLSSTTALADPKLSERIKVSPEVDKLVVSSAWNGISLSGEFEGNTKYTVEVDGGLQDRFGQTLGKPFKASIKLGPQFPNLELTQARTQPLVVEAGSKPSLRLRVAGLDAVEIEARAIEGKELHTFSNGYWDRNWAWPSDRGTSTFEKTFDTTASLRKPSELALPLQEMLAGGASKGTIGWFIARSNEFELWGYKQRKGIAQTFTVTDLGIAAALDHAGGLVAVHSLSTNDPVAGATVTLIDRYGSTKWTGTTDAAGQAEPEASIDSGYIMVQTATDAAYLPASSQSIAGGWSSRNAPSDRPRAFFFTDRTPYKPGETIHLVGILRQEEAKPEGSLALYRSDSTAAYRVTNPRGIEVATGDVSVSKLGAFTLDIDTKEEHGTGNFTLVLTFANWFGSAQTFRHSIPVETFRTPEFEVDVERPTSKPLVYEDTLNAEVLAKYLHGAPMVGADVRYSLNRTDSGFTPPGELNRDFSFGSGSPYRRYGWWTPPSRIVASGSGETTAQGVFEVEHVLHAVDPVPAAKPDAVTPAEPDKDEAPPAASTYSLSATVTDENRQAISGSASFVVHPATVYVGLRSDAMVLKEGEQTTVQAVLVDLEGERVPGKPVAIEVLRRETVRTAVEKDGRWSFSYETKDQEVSTCNVTSKAVSATCDITVDTAGTYLIRGSAKDDEGRATRTETQFYVHGKDAVVWGQNTSRVDLVPDRSEYAPGDTANILVRSPYDEAHGILVVEREGIAKRFPLEVHGGTAAVEVPLSKTWAPGVTASAMLWRGRTEVEGAPPGQDLGLPAAAGGKVELKISADEHRIDVGVDLSSKEIEPKGKLTVNLSTKDAGGKAVSSGVALMVVDEGVLSLMNYATPDPLGFFIRKRNGGVWMNALHRNVLPREAGAPEPDTEGEPEPEPQPDAEPMELEESADDGDMAYASEPMAPPSPTASAAPGGGARQRSMLKGRAEKKSKESAGYGSGQTLGGNTAGFAFRAEEAMAQEVSLRTLFASTAYFAGDLQTDAEGKLSVTIDMPENLTTFRVMAVAIDREEVDRFGSGDAQVRVRKPIMLRPSLPRFANYGDAFEASVMVDNQTGENQKVLVGTRGLNVTVGTEDQKFIDIPAGESKEVRFDMKTEAVGTMRVQFAAMSSAGRDATQLEVPVNYPATSEAFADYGMTEDSILRTLEAPKDVLSAFGGLELSFSSTALSGLEDSVQYLVDYRYECAEQTSSRVLPIFVLGDILDEFPIASVRDRVSRTAIATRGVEKLFTKQNPDGGFGYWHRGESWPYVSTWATFALLEGKKAGFDVDEGKLNAALNYVENFVRYGHRSRWGVYYDWTTRSFAIWLLSRESRGEKLFGTVWTHRDKLPLYARAYLMSAAHNYGKTAERDEILAQLREAVIESPKTIHFEEGRSEADAADGLRVLMHSNVQTDAIVLMAMLDAAPKDPMLPKVMAGIMASRDPMKGGRWGSTHTNAWALVAASRYYEVVEADEPNFEAQAWLGDAFAGSFTFEGRSMTKQQQNIPMKALQESGADSLTLAKKGPGKLYYRLGLRYAPDDLQLDARSQGFVVSRHYAAMPEQGETEPDPKAVRRLNDGSWVIKAGTNIKISLNVVVRDRANYVVVDDALPAGFEGLNPRFVTSGAGAISGSVTTGGPSGGYRSRWWYPWWTFDHSDLRDDRMLLFADTLPAGVYTYAYTARATTIGDFQLPPVKAEAMYEPERFGHSSSSRVKVIE